MFSYVVDILNKKKNYTIQIFQLLELKIIQMSKNIVEKSFTRHVYLKILIIHDYNFILQEN